jgi:Xaa-Pro aminopeptidase
VVVVSARRGVGSYLISETEDKPWIDSLEVIAHEDDPKQVLAGILSRIDAEQGVVAVDDRVWSQTTFVLQELLPGFEFVSASEIVWPMRQVKETEELDALRRSAEITGKAFEKAVANLKPGITEMDVAAEIDYQFKALGAQFNAFVTGIRFVGPGRPYIYGFRRSGDKKLIPGDSITFDLGCVCQGYCSDFGRSAFVGEPPEAYAEIHELVLEAERAGMEAMVPGSATASDVISAVQELIMAHGYEQDLRHGVGHGIGVDTHEPPFLSYLDETVLETNMTFALEPSISYPGLEKSDWRNRVEDMIVVTEEAGEFLSHTDRRLYLVEG